MMGMKSLLARAQHVAALAAEYAEASERGCRLAAPVVDAFVASGLARLIAPTALGGWAAHPATVLEVVETVAAADPSAGWCVGIGVGSNHLAGFLPAAGARELFFDLDQPGSAVFAPQGRARRTCRGFRLSGKWAFASGCQQAGVLAGGMFNVNPDGDMERDANGMPIHRLAFVPGNAVRIEETWDTVGLRGTGSHDAELVDYRVGIEHTMRVGDASWCDDVIYQLPTFAAVLGPCLAGAALGAGRAGLDALEVSIRASHAAPRPGVKPPFGDDALSQVEVARVEVRLRSVRALLLDVLDEAYQSGVAGRRPSPSETALVGLACQEAMSAAVDAIDVACRLSGSSSARRQSRLERLHRDVATMRHHVMFTPSLTASLGRQLAGVPTVAWPFIMPSEHLAA
jgi:alkylation response protein AidB-like acyl-CoA dehydrogenase